MKSEGFSLCNVINRNLKVRRSFLERKMLDCVLNSLFGHFLFCSFLKCSTCIFFHFSTAETDLTTYIYIVFSPIPHLMKIAWCWQKVFPFFPYGSNFTHYGSQDFQYYKSRTSLSNIHCITPFLQVPGGRDWLLLGQHLVYIKVPAASTTAGCNPLKIRS